MSIPDTPQLPAQTPTCYRHPDRPTYVRCTRCQRPICPDCMRSAAVGHQCVECVNQGAKSVQAPRTQFGGKVSTGTPVLTYALIAANVLMFVLQMALGNLTTDLTLWPRGIAFGDQYYRLVTSAFLHYGITHLLFNMWALYVVGPPLEAWLGRLRFGALYALSGLGGSVLVYLLTPLDTPTAGASGAIFGLFGAIFVVARKLNLDVRWIAAVVVLNLVFTFAGPALGTGAISWQGHVGGLITGAGIAAAYVYAPSARRNAVQAGVSVAVLLVFAALIAWRTSELLALVAVR
ncbi:MULTISPECIES: rhomboid family intramembrane serine protease [unclassified Mycolicibacterium]|uniref:rhomboid family intramembrane serine protease n=1 Tax=unclassified Mycolicibacterium TaxID=2636767 RepID=UPI0012DE711E|nr:MULTISPECIES: rhomboid family intramembrane serine protease [unclassified Mycolicibacterium]MUL84914.1 rhomboid family intramembrane serine protease [Mycolicibacterium sp. CBMA 329]MUL90881.1 rhomboid family intramembrane serine protease [Mycolicibacterium sp. CBMA 331]MUM29252.1 rhomboid family intramembrane serine protease [Mycolicibacterium sp. CBMA 295]MUM40640.1 rhomboid family intramembrane serine protease [Mycolicibacterium sp. CBMA 247]MUM46836.1 rhomboid family intramembrane serine